MTLHLVEYRSHTAPDAWFQLPAEVTISRFFHGMQDSSNKLVEKYGTVKDMNSTVSKPMYVQKFSSELQKNAPTNPVNPFAPPYPNPLYQKISTATKRTNMSEENTIARATWLLQWSWAMSPISAPSTNKPPNSFNSMTLVHSAVNMSSPRFSESKK